jgi:Rod binding domain-containing protein
VISHITSVTGSAGASSTASTPSPRLVNAAHEFEAQLMSELLKPMNKALSANPDDDDSDSGSTNAMGAYATEALARAISNQGGLGIADHIVHSLSSTGNPKSAMSVMGDLRTNTVTAATK